ncbi:hypothetical protein Q648_00369 [Bartonella quintana JK 12]|uniref:tRNA-guanine(15) transglycosylase-like domain-containing protein n=2 Tax=Bartonella quintana TaxID=803 RepID=W3TWM2_BARQI|nr:hypothetical protein Q651_00134 [Bartonella quintana BQ2-D70]ETS14158.1 hypothetical protein Q650_00782 [Bartonella quintana JK 73rel]ETS15845.1 hypothetical protein Q649_00791 [Bartonella quintana JK 73]ETS17848.1 hypothetical protein Q647_00780 [Bartonella quintana JK 7]ETS18677.1 hypothetical protein Q648_00369 [Bartonella quintana JK 12]KEC59143.1 tRNA-guanine transglycosylase [Bartonella quintana JK 19]KEC62753.1 tRNA-guanine transglycosylase [Bartonella quintana JK 63]KEC63389.1 tRN
MIAVLDSICPILPGDKLRYLMRVGTLDDILQSVACGIDMFDCVMPMRAGYHGLAFTRFGRINLCNARYVEDPYPLDPQSLCSAACDL